MGTDSESKSRLSRQERIIEDPDVERVLQTFGATELEDENLKLFFKALEGGESELESVSKKLAKQLGQPLSNIKLGLRTIKNICAGKSFNGVGGADSQLVEGDYHHRGLSHK